MFNVCILLCCNLVVTNVILLVHGHGGFRFCATPRRLPHNVHADATVLGINMIACVMIAIVVATVGLVVRWFRCGGIPRISCYVQRFVCVNRPQFLVFTEVLQFLIGNTVLGGVDVNSKAYRNISRIKGRQFQLNMHTRFSVSTMEKMTNRSCFQERTQVNRVNNVTLRNLGRLANRLISINANLNNGQRAGRRFIKQVRFFR